MYLNRGVDTPLNSNKPMKSFVSLFHVLVPQTGRDGHRTHVPHMTSPLPSLPLWQTWLKDVGLWEVIKVGRVVYALDFDGDGRRAFPVEAVQGGWEGGRILYWMGIFPQGAVCSGAVSESGAREAFSPFAFSWMVPTLRHTTVRYLMCSQSTDSKNWWLLISSTFAAPILFSASVQYLQGEQTLLLWAHSTKMLEKNENLLLIGRDSDMVRLQHFKSQPKTGKVK